MACGATRPTRRATRAAAARVRRSSAGSAPRASWRAMAPKGPITTPSRGHGSRRGWAAGLHLDGRPARSATSRSAVSRRAGLRVADMDGAHGLRAGERHARVQAVARRAEAGAQVRQGPAGGHLALCSMTMSSQSSSTWRRLCAESRMALPSLRSVRRTASSSRRVPGSRPEAARRGGGRQGRAGGRGRWRPCVCEPLLSCPLGRVQNERSSRSRSRRSSARWRAAARSSRCRRAKKARYCSGVSSS